MKEHIHIVKSIVPGSIADEMGIAPGDRLISINGQEIEDIFDYQFYSEDEELLLLIEKPGKMQAKSWGWNSVPVSWMNTDPAGTSASSALSTRCPPECGIPFTLKMMIPGCLFFRGIM